MRTFLTFKAVSSAATVALLIDGTNSRPPAVEAEKSPSPAFRRTKMGAALLLLVTGPLKSIYARLAPVAYEDERGFHYGEP